MSHGEDQNLISRKKRGESEKPYVGWKLSFRRATVVLAKRTGADEAEDPDFLEGEVIGGQEPS